jgi:hypothetical protein
MTDQTTESFSQSEDEDNVEVSNEFVEEADGVDKINSLLDKASISQNISGMVKYKGVMVSHNTATVLNHISDKMQDHFDGDVVPNLAVSICPLACLPYDEKYRSKSDEPGDRWYSVIEVNYNILNTKCTFNVVGVDNVYIDMVPKISKDGSVAKNYGISWLNLYFPKGTLRQIFASFKQSTSWNVSNSGLTVDDEQGLVSTVVNMDLEDTPTFRTSLRDSPFLAAGGLELLRHIHKVQFFLDGLGGRRNQIAVSLHPANTENLGPLWNGLGVRRHDSER